MRMLLMIAVALSLWSAPAVAQRWDLDEGFIRSEGGWLATAALRTRGAALTVRCVDDRLDAYLVPSFRTNGLTSLQVRITLPDRDPVVQTWPVEPEMGAGFSPSAGRLARQLLQSDAMTLEVADAEGTFRPVRLSSAAASDAIGRVLQTCAVPAEDLDTLLPTVDTQIIDTIDQLDMPTAWSMRRWLLDPSESADLAVRPLALYRRLNYFYAVTLPAICQDELSGFWNMPACDGLRTRLARDGMPVPDTDPFTAFRLYHRMGGRVFDPGPRPAGCTEPDTTPEPLNEFDFNKVFIDSSGRTLTGGVARVAVTISAEGDVSDVRILLARPVARFERALEREVRAMRFAPERVNCQPIASQFLMGYTAYLGQSVFPLMPPTF